MGYLYRPKLKSGARDSARFRLVVIAIVTLATLLIPREAWVWTQVRHGESPKFSVPISGSYCITIVGHYTGSTDRH